MDKLFRPMNLIFVGGLFTLLGSAIVLWGTYKQNQANQTRNQQVNKMHEYITGAGNTPQIVMTSTILVTDDVQLPEHYQISFKIKNNGEVPLRDVRIKISDPYGKDIIFPYGVYLSVNARLHEDNDELNKKNYLEYKINKEFLIGSMAPKTGDFFYTTSCLSMGDFPLIYGITLDWENGQLTFVTKFKTGGKRLILESEESYFNGIKTTDKNLFIFKPD
jgi:hypothetical protein